MRVRRTIQKSAFTLELFEEGSLVGYVDVLKRKDHAKVGWIVSLVPRRGYGTRMYEEAARLSCSLWGVPLGSGEQRSAAASGFWLKQEQRGRARCVKRRRDGQCRRYALSCPAPESLSRAR